MICRAIHSKIRGAASFALFFVLASCLSEARNADGTLAVILFPNNGCPAFVTPNGTLEIVTRDECTLFLVGPKGEQPLSFEQQHRERGNIVYRCLAPDVPEGMYGLRAEGKSSDTMPRCVIVRKEFPEYYPIAHVAGLAVHRDASVEERNAALISKLNESDAAVVFISGVPTGEGSSEEFLRLLTVLEAINRPTVVIPRSSGPENEIFSQYFGMYPSAITYGRDAFLLFCPVWNSPLTDYDVQTRELYYLRRATRAARWSVGIASRYTPSVPLRTQLALFSDDPLDYLLFGYATEAEAPQSRRVPWETTRLIGTISAAQGKFQIIDVTVSGLLPRPDVTFAPSPP